MTLPAHRFEERKKKNKPKVWVFDFDETITATPGHLRRIATALRAMGDSIVVVTGNDSPRQELLDRLRNDYQFPFDDLIQYADEESFGLRRAAILKELDAYGAFDDRSGRAYVLVDACSHFFVAAKPPKDATKGDKGDAKQAVKDQQG